jgi:hypothetical protein
MFHVTFSDSSDPLPIDPADSHDHSSSSSHSAGSPTGFDVRVPTAAAEDHSPSESYEEEYEEEGPDPYRVFFIRRIRRAHIRAPLLFNFFSKGAVIYSAKSHQIHGDTVFISESPTIHIKMRQFDWVLRISKGRCVFELSRKDSQEREMHISMTNDYGKAIGPRKIEINIAPQTHLHSKVPLLTPTGKWCLPFNGKYVVRSQKNAVLLDSENHSVILIRKIESSALELETIKAFSSLHLFVIGIASFICPI